MRIALLLLALMPAVAVAAPKLPDYFKLPPQFHVNGDAVTDEKFGEADMPMGDDDVVVKSGHHWYVEGAIDLPEETGHEALWKPFRDALAAAGWTVQHSWADANPPSATVRYVKNGKEAWANLGLFGTTDIRIHIIEVAALGANFVIKPPAAAPEKLADNADIPYLPPLPGARRGQVDHLDSPLMVTIAGNDEALAVASGHMQYNYDVPESVSNLEFANTYHQALEKAGWTILSESHGTHQTDATLDAHYAHAPRDIWAALHFAPGNLSISVADVGAENWGKTLESQCHLALYGVNFDFNKATLRSESASVLDKVLAIFKASPALKVEIQGHTDNVGGDDYNLKLSQARAESVRAWLVAHGVAADRLTAHGYGRTQPVADNGTDEGRAKNRRVELKRVDCK